MKLKRAPSPLEQAEHWIMHWRRSLDSKLYDSDEWRFASQQLDSWLDKWRELREIASQKGIIEVACQSGLNTDHVGSGVISQGWYSKPIPRTSSVPATGVFVPRAPKLCSYAGCYETATHSSRCEDHKYQDHRPSAAARGYDHEHRTRFRPGVLTRDPQCVWPGCSSPSAHADHHPHSRRQLVQLGLDANDPQYGRGLCHSHHSHSTNVQEKTP